MVDNSTLVLLDNVVNSWLIGLNPADLIPILEDCRNEFEANNADNRYDETIRAINSFIVECGENDYAV